MCYHNNKKVFLKSFRASLGCDFCRFRLMERMKVVFFLGTAAGKILSDCSLAPGRSETDGSCSNAKTLGKVKFRVKADISEDRRGGRGTEEKTEEGSKEGVSVSLGRRDKRGSPRQRSQDEKEQKLQM